MNKHKSNKIKENSNTVRHLIMGQIITTQNLVATKVVRLAGQWFHTNNGGAHAFKMEKLLIVFVLTNQSLWWNAWLDSSQKIISFSFEFRACLSPSTLRVRLNGRLCKDDIFKCISWMKIIVYIDSNDWQWIKLPVSQHWSMSCHGHEQATCLNQCWLSSLTSCGLTGPQWVNCVCAFNWTLVVNALYWSWLCSYQKIILFFLEVHAYLLSISVVLGMSNWTSL